MVAIKEIGSEFHSVSFETGKGLVYPKTQDSVLCFSGRGALETALANLVGIRKALLPSYCCTSMIEPFLRRGIEVDFYSVNYKNGFNIEMDIPQNTDVLLWCNYFGFNIPMPDISDFVKRGGIIIEDITHSLFSKQSYHMGSHYLVASLRKWEPIYCGGYCASMYTHLDHKPNQPPNEQFITLKSRAMKLKGQYLIDGDEQKKEQFLKLFQESSQWFKNQSSVIFNIDSRSRQFLESIDMVSQRSIRQKNAHVLYKGLKNRVQFLFSEDSMDCPLFVPIFCPDNFETIKNTLQRNKIYCPSHWPCPKVECQSNLYGKELSLVCDQRYTEQDMQRIVNVLSSVL